MQGDSLLFLFALLQFATHSHARDCGLRISASRGNECSECAFLLDHSKPHALRHLVAFHDLTLRQLHGNIAFRFPFQVGESSASQTSYQGGCGYRACLHLPAGASASWLGLHIQSLAVHVCCLQAHMRRRACGGGYAATDTEAVLGEAIVELDGSKLFTEGSTILQAVQEQRVPSLNSHKQTRCILIVLLKEHHEPRTSSRVIESPPTVRGLRRCQRDTCTCNL